MHAEMFKIKNKNKKVSSYKKYTKLKSLQFNEALSPTTKSPSD
jgi:hypothetical protein